MDIALFRHSIQEGVFPKGMAPHLHSLWLDARGDWEGAHRVIQDEPGSLAARIHGYLHRKEGDSGNAAYWYRRAGAAPARGTLQQEWEELALLCLEAEQ